MIYTVTKGASASSASASASSAADDGSASSKSGKSTIIGLSVAGGIALVGIGVFVWWKFGRKRGGDEFDDSECLFLWVVWFLINLSFSLSLALDLLPTATPRTPQNTRFPYFYLTMVHSFGKTKPSNGPNSTPTATTSPNSHPTVPQALKPIRKSTLPVQIPAPVLSLPPQRLLPPISILPLQIHMPFLLFLILILINLIVMIRM